MYLKSLHLENFRSYDNIKLTFDKSLNVIIGKNDIGKSTILEALDIFFGQERIKIDIDDQNVHTRGDISITCVFEVDSNREYLIDSDVRTKLSDEYLLNSDGNLEIRKVWDCSKDKLTATSLKTFIRCNYPREFSDKPLPTLKIDELKKILENSDNKDIAFGLAEKLNNNELEGLEVGPWSSDEGGNIPITIDKRKRAEIRKAIYEVLDDKELQEVLIPLDKEDCKNIWSSISTDLPLFFLFQSDRTNKDTDKEVQDPLKTITKLAISNVQDKLDEVKNLISDYADKIGRETIEKLKEMNRELAEVLQPDVTNKAWDSLFSFSFIGDDNIPMNKRGSGVRRLILLNYFRAEAERQNTSNKTVIYAIEEPETSQHPDHQKLLIEALVEIGNKVNYQVVVTTHSPEIAKQTKDENLILIDKVEGRTQIVNTENRLKAISKTLGLTPYLGKLVICVEGENDRRFLMGINQAIPELKSIIDLKHEDISIIPMGGSKLVNWIDRNYLNGSNIVEFHLYDKDADEKYKASVDVVNSREDKSFGILTQKREIENYVHWSLYESEFSISLDKRDNWDNDDIPNLVLGKNTKFDDEETIKQITNGKLSKLMTKNFLEELNAYDEVEGWFKVIADIYEI